MEFLINLLFDLKKEEFKFQRAVHLYLFLIWCIKPGKPENPPHMRYIAASAALQLTFAVTDKNEELTAKSNSNLSALQARLGRNWYQQFHAQFIEKIGGLKNAINAPHRSSEDQLRMDRYSGNERELAIVEYIAKAISVDLTYADRPRVFAGFQRDVLLKGDAFYRKMGEKRKEATGRAKQQNGFAPTISGTAFDNHWDGAPRTIVLL